MFTLPSLARRAHHACAVCVLFSFVFLSSCEEATGPTTDATSLDSSVIIVNQGQFSSDNSTLTRINRANDSVNANWFGSKNPGRKLGATANDIVFKGDTAFITVTKSHAIEVINAKTGVHLQTIMLASTDDPWNIALIHDQLGVVSTTNGDGVQFFNPRTFSLLNKVSTGPATQGIAVTPDYVFVANSGYGTLRDTVAGAGTVSVIDLRTMLVSYQLTVGKNVTELQLNANKTKLYAYYQELYTNPTAKQGVVEFDVATKLETRRWLVNGSGFLNFSAGKVYYVGKNSTSDVDSKIMSIDVTTVSALPQIVASIPPTLSVNGLSIHKDGSFWLCDALDYTSNGQIVVLNSLGNKIKTYPCGLNPGRAAFFH